MGHPSPTVIGRYALFDKIASGGMASVHYGRLIGDSGFSRTVAIKRLHPHLAQDPEFSIGFRDEARVAARIRHPNVVPTLDVVSTDEELFLVMEYVHGEALNRLVRAAIKRGERVPPPVAAAIIVGVLHGLHAAHEATGEDGAPLHVVHRDVSPQNILVGVDGIPRLVDFGVAKAAGRGQSTREGTIKGKVAYMAPEQIRGAAATRLMDIYGAAVVLWEMLTGERLFDGENDVTVLDRAAHMTVEAPSTRVPTLAPALDRVVLKGLDRDPEKRFRTAREMARALEDSTTIASNSRVGEWVDSVANEALAKRAKKISEIEQSPRATSSRPRLADDTVPVDPISLTASALVPDDPPTVEEAKQEPASVPSKVERSAALSKPPVVIGASVPPAAASAHSNEISSVVSPAPRKSLVVLAALVAVGGALALEAAVFAYRALHRNETEQSTAVTPAIAESAAPVAASASASSAPVIAESATAEPTIAEPETVEPHADDTAMPPATSTTPAPPSHPTSSHASPSPITATHATHASATATTTATEISRTPPPSAKPGCTPPYTVDANGTKHYKVQCF